jgi:hypothetical protein
VSRASSHLQPVFLSPSGMGPQRGVTDGSGADIASFLPNHSQAFIAARAKEARSAKAAHEKTKQTLQRAQQVTAEYEKKVNTALEEHTTKV